MDLDRLRALVCFARKGNLAQAASELNLSAATLRKRLDELEAEVGVALLDPGGRRLGLSPAGEQLVREGVELLARADAIAASLGDGDEEPTGVIIVATPIGLPTLPHIAFIADSIGRFPTARFRSTPAARPLELLPDAADIAVNFGTRPSQGAFLVVRMALMTELLLASPSYLARKGCPRSPDELRGHALLSWEPPDRPADRWSFVDGRELEVALTLSSPDIGLIVAAAGAGLGIARVPHPHSSLGPDPFVEPSLELTRVLPEHLATPVPIYVAIPDSKKVRGPLRRFVARVREHERSMRGA